MAFPILLLNILSYFLHLTARVPVLGSFRFDLLLGVGSLLLVLIQQRQDTLRSGEETARRLYWFLLYILLSLPLVTWPGSVIQNNLTEWMKVAILFLLVVGAVRTEKQLRLFIWVFLLCQVFRALEPLYLHITTGYWGSIAYSHTDGVMTGLNRLSGAPSDVVNPNQLAWVIVSTIPYLFYLLWQWNKWGKLFMVLLALPSIYALLLTGSRSGLLSFMVVIIGIVLLSRNRRRNLVITLLVVLPLGILLMGQLSSDMQTRYLSLVDSTVAGGDTKLGRINGMVKQFGTISHNPLFGNGLGTTREANWNIMGGSSQITHNMYLEILQSTGIIGFSLFVSYVVSIVRSLRKAKQILVLKGASGNDWLMRLVSATLVWVIMDLFYSFSCFGLISWEWYFFGGVATVCHALAQEREDLHNAEPELA
ncbi:MAG: O-antigen ligase family protein [Desulfuromonadaceae bacterium]|nr:O-antigen ligase family protein [Desulfuromonadaceae bacterium]